MAFFKLVRGTVVEHAAMITWAFGIRKPPIGAWEPFGEMACCEAEPA